MGISFGIFHVREDEALFLRRGEGEILRIAIVIDLLGVFNEIHDRNGL